MEKKELTKRQIYDKKYREQNKEKIKEYRNKNKEKLKEKAKIYNKENKETKKEKAKIYNKENFKKMKEYNKEYNKENKEKLKEKAKIYNKENSKKMKEKAKIYNKENSKKMKEYNKEYNKENKEKRKIYNKEYILNNIDKIKIYNNSIHGKAIKLKNKIKRRELEKLYDSNYSKDDILYTQELFENKCFNCNSKENIHIDHHNPLVLGFGLSRTNAVLLCSKCNITKGPKRPQEFYEENQIKLLEEQYKIITVQTKEI